MTPHNDRPSFLTVLLSQLRRLTTLELIQLIAGVSLELQRRYVAEQHGQDLSPAPSTADSEVSE